MSGLALTATQQNTKYEPLLPCLMYQESLQITTCITVTSVVFIGVGRIEYEQFSQSCIYSGVKNEELSHHITDWLFNSRVHWLYRD